MTWPSCFHSVRTNIDAKTLANDTKNHGQVVPARGNAPASWSGANAIFLVAGRLTLGRLGITLHLCRHRIHTSER